jgi:allantoinase
MSKTDLVIRGRRVVFAEQVAPASIHVGNDRILRVAEYDEISSDCEVVEADTDSVIMAGLVDTHVHINEPGRSEWEGFQTATQAAAAGGVTTLIDMPLNSIPPTTTVEGLKTKLSAALNNCYVDIGFWGGVVPGNTGELAALKNAGVVGFKCFLVPSGVEEFPHVTEADLRQAMPELTRLNSLLIVHAELPGPIENRTPAVKSASEYSVFLSSRPREAENDAINLMIRLSREFGTRIHIVHLSSADAIPAIRKAQAEGVRITAETCPHYLHFEAETVPSGATEFKCCPPIRESDNRERLWAGLKDGVIAFIVSDHSPCPAAMKLPECGDFLGAWGGIASLQLRLPVIWSESRKRGFTLIDIARWLCSEPAKQVGLQDRKGLIAEGLDADLVIWSADQQFEVTPTALLQRHKISPYRGELLQGVVQKTFLRGRKLYDGREIQGPPMGKFVLGSQISNSRSQISE